MQSILDPQEAPEAASSSPPRSSDAPLYVAIASVGLALVTMGLAVVLLLQIRQLRTELGTLRGEVKDIGTQAASTESKATELDLGLAAVQGQAETIAERVGFTEAELQRTAKTARQVREDQRKGQATLESAVGQVRDDVAASRAAIEQTQAQLQRAVGDLGEQSGLIARNADELEALKRTNLRDYFEFDISKAKRPTRVGAVAIRLKGADAKRHKFDMVLVVDDVEIEKKDKTLLEPVQFYRKGSRQLHEIVVYQVTKNRIAGYLSAPKASPPPPATPSPAP